VNGPPEAVTSSEEQAIYPPVVLSEALAEQVKDLLTASEDAARAIRKEAELERPQLEASVSELRELVDDLRTDVDRLTTELTLVGRETRALPPPADAEAPSSGFDRRALLIALNMASNGASRAEVAAYLADNLNIRDCDELLDAVYGYVDSTAA
jgi:hypothetical protein